MNATATSTSELKIALSEAQARRVGMLAKRAGQTPQEWLDAAAERAVDLALGISRMLSAKEAAAELGVNNVTVLQYFHAGKFPNAYMANRRVVRIPAADVQRFKKLNRPVKGRAA